MDKTTQLIHHPYHPPEGFSAPQAGVFKASTIFFKNTAAMRQSYKDELGHQYTYGTKGTPTTFLLEERLCTLEGGKYCCLVPSGLAAIALVSFALLKSGDEVLLPDNAYSPSKTLLDGELKGLGISYQLYDAMNPANLASKINANNKKNTKLVWLEAAGSVTLEFPNLPELVRICQAAGVTTALDNTWGAGLAFAPFHLTAEGGAGDTDTDAGQGVDISVQALTKYPSGGGDVLMGSVITRDEQLFAHIKRCHMRMGYSVGLNDVEAILRALPSMALRYRAHDASTRQLAQWAQQQPCVAQVLHPALPDSPGHLNWKVLCSKSSKYKNDSKLSNKIAGDSDDDSDDDSDNGDAACLFSIIIHERYSSAQVDAFCDALKLFKLGYSWAGPVSLVVPYDLRSMRSGRWPAHLKAGTLVRFSVGLENVADLQADLAQAMQVALN